VWFWAFIGLCWVMTVALGGKITLKEEWWTE
jgi:hypothetical protein